MVGGYYFSDIVKTIEDKWFHKNAMSDDEKEAVISKKLENLNNQMELQKFINHLQMSKMHEIDAWPNKMSASLKDIITKYPEMSMMASYIVTKIFEKASQINHLYVSMRQDQPDLVSIGEILHNGQFGGLHRKSVKVHSVTSPKPGMVRFEMSGSKISQLGSF